MLRRTLYGAAAVSLLVVVSAGAADAQFASAVRFNVHAGASLPTGTLGDEGGAELGFRLGAGLELRAPAMPIGLRFDGAYDRMGIEDIDLAYSIWNLTANAVVSPMASPLYFIGGIGFYSLDLTGDDLAEFEAVFGEVDAETEFGFNIGAGFSLPLTGFSTFIEARWHNINTEGDNLSYVPIVFGIRF